MLPRAGFTTLGYDDEMRLTDVIDVEERSGASSTTPSGG